jgi:hypothetical protein
MGFCLYQLSSHTPLGLLHHRMGIVGKAPTLIYRTFRDAVSRQAKEELT